MKRNIPKIKTPATRATHDKLYEEIRGWLKATNFARPPRAKDSLFALTDHIEGHEPPTQEQFIFLHTYIGGDILATQRPFWFMLAIARS